MFVDLRLDASHVSEMLLISVQVRYSFLTPATNQTVTVSRVTDTVDRLYGDPYLAVSLMYISRARKALFNLLSRNYISHHFNTFNLADNS